MIRSIVLLSLLAALAAGPAGAEGLRLSGSSKSRASLFASQTALLDGRLSRQYSGSTRLQPKAKIEEVSVQLPSYRGSYKGQYLETARSAARKNGVPEDLFLRLVQQESGWNAGAVSPKGATGLAQLMPETAQLLRVDINDPSENLDGGARYLAMMYAKFGNWKHALAAYNAGPKAVEKHGGIPPYAETQSYVTAILGG